jgi:hypothetical protein
MWIRSLYGDYHDVISVSVCKINEGHAEIHGLLSNGKLLEMGVFSEENAEEKAHAVIDRAFEEANVHFVEIKASSK